MRDLAYWRGIEFTQPRGKFAGHLSISLACPTLMMTESVKGMPTMEKRMQKTRPAVDTGAMLP